MKPAVVELNGITEQLALASVLAMRQLNEVHFAPHPKRKIQLLKESVASKSHQKALRMYWKWHGLKYTKNES